MKKSRYSVSRVLSLIISVNYIYTNLLPGKAGSTNRARLKNLFPVYPEEAFRVIIKTVNIWLKILKLK